MFHQKFC